MHPVDFSHFVDQLAELAGAATLPFFRTALMADDKSCGKTFDPVTEADRAAETAMRNLIKLTFPEHGIKGEEYGNENEEAEFVWVLDPIDGTRAFMAGLPVWSTLIGLTHNKKPCYGMMHQPFTREYFSSDGGATFYRHNGKKRQLMTRHCSSLSQATLATTSPNLFLEHERKAYSNIEQKTRFVRYGCDAYAYCMVAAGHIDLVIETGLKPYDIVALIPIIEGAGGIITTWQGGSAENGGAIIAAGDKALHAEALEILINA